MRPVICRVSNALVAFALLLTCLPMFSQGTPTDCQSIAACEILQQEYMAVDLDSNPQGLNFRNRISGSLPVGTGLVSNGESFSSTSGPALYPSTAPTSADLSGLLSVATPESGFTVAMVAYLTPQATAKNGAIIPLASFFTAASGPAQPISILGFNGQNFTVESVLSDTLRSPYVQTFWDPAMYTPATGAYAADGFYEIFFTVHADSTGTLDVFHIDPTLPRLFTWSESTLDAGWPVRYTVTDSGTPKIPAGNGPIYVGMFYPPQSFAALGFASAKATSAIPVSDLTIYNKPLTRNMLLGAFDDLVYSRAIGNPSPTGSDILIDSDLNDDAVVPNIDLPSELLPCNTGRFLSKSGQVIPVNTPCLTQAFVPPAAPPSVLAVNVSEPQAGTLSATWSPVGTASGGLNVAGYTANLYDYDTSVWMLIESRPVLATASPSVQFTNLNSNASYRVGVTANTNYMTGPETRTQASYSPLPATLEPCASENGVCSGNAGDIVGFGAGADFDDFYYKTSTSGILPCSINIFGDPAVGVGKTCWSTPAYSLPVGPSGYTFCAYEGGTCTAPGSAMFAYGVRRQPVASTNFATMQVNGTGLAPVSIACGTAAFGTDPAVLYLKSCFVKTLTNPYVSGLQVTPGQASLTATWGVPVAATYTVSLLNNGQVVSSLTTTAGSATFTRLIPGGNYTIVVVPTAAGTTTGAPAVSPVVQPLDIQWTQCTAEGGTCALLANAVYRFSPTSARYQPGIFANIPVTTLATPCTSFTSGNRSIPCTTPPTINFPVPCRDGVFGDPAPGVVKNCWYAAAALFPLAPDGQFVSSGWIFCGYQNDTCTIPPGATATIDFGTGTRWTSATNVAGSILCSAANIADPAPGLDKACFMKFNYPVPGIYASLIINYNSATQFLTSSWQPPANLAGLLAGVTQQDYISCTISHTTESVIAQLPGYATSYTPSISGCVYFQTQVQASTPAGLSPLATDVYP